jgi:DNA-3-methyladenine glycosylase II
LTERDPILKDLFEAAGPPRLRPPQESHFAALVRSVVYQQLAGAAAAAIHGRLILELSGEVTPEALLATEPDRLRDLATKVEDGTVELEPRRIARLSDDEVIARLSSVRGIGRWTSQMFLMFQLRRLDVWPAGDLGVRRGFGLAWGIAMPSERELEPLGEPFIPYRSVVAWYCWRANEIYRGAGESALTT